MPSRQGLYATDGSYRVTLVASGRGGGDNGTDLYTLLDNETATGALVEISSSGDYIYTITTTNWNGATATLRYLGPDGITYLDVVSTTSNLTDVVAITAGTSLQVTITGAVPGAGVYATLGLLG